MKKNNSSKYRIAVIDDLSRVMEIIEDGRALLKEEGNGQWQDGYPTQEDLKNDILNKQLYVVLDQEKIAGVMAITGYEEPYHHLYEGKWLSDYDYLVMHRIAVGKEYRGHGYGKALFDVFELVAKSRNIHSLRVDTHINNHLMIHLMEKAGFIYCGKVILPPHKDRVVYEKII